MIQLFRKKFPIITVSLTLLCTAIHFLVEQKHDLYLAKELIWQGEYWRAVTGHFIHSDFQHLLWNGVGLLILGLLIERHSTKLLLLTLVSGLLSVNTLLLNPLSTIDLYCGLSGVLNSLLVVALWLEWKASHSKIILLVATGCISKIVLEILVGQALFTDISWPPYPWSHLAGFFGGLFVVALMRIRKLRLIGYLEGYIAH